VVLERGDDLTWLSLRNVDTVHLLAVDQLNTYDVLLSDDVVFTKGAYDSFVGDRAVTEPASETAAEPASETVAEPASETAADTPTEEEAS
jgi:large subunit ribosomal protein L4